MKEIQKATSIEWQTIANEIKEVDNAMSAKQYKLPSLATMKSEGVDADKFSATVLAYHLSTFGKSLDIVTPPAGSNEYINLAKRISSRFYWFTLADVQAAVCQGAKKDAKAYTINVARVLSWFDDYANEREQAYKSNPVDTLSTLEGLANPKLLK